MATTKLAPANVKNNETSAMPDLTARSNHKNYNNQTTIKHQSGTRKVKDSQTNLLNVDYIEPKH